jgi:predicted esterase
MHRRRHAVVAGVLGLAMSGLLPAPTASAGLAEPVEPSAGGYLSQGTVTVPARSQVYPRNNAVTTVGTPPADGRIRVDGDPGDWAATPTWINGTGRYDNGEYVWTDFPYDDAGTGSLSYPGEGDATDVAATADSVARFSPGSRMARYGANAADIVEQRVAADDRYVYLLTRLNFLNAVNSTVVGLGFDLDKDRQTGFSAWPAGARLRTPGLDLFVTLHGDGATLTRPGGTVDLADVGGSAVTDTASNTMEVALPRALFAGSASFDLVGGAGLWNPAAGTWSAPAADASPLAKWGGIYTHNDTDAPGGGLSATDPAAFDLLFNPPTSVADRPKTGVPPTNPRTFQAEDQAAQLASGTTGGYEQTISLDRAAAGAAGDPQLLRPAGTTQFTRTVLSRLDLEGLIYQSSQVIYLGRFSPYFVDVPACYPACPKWPGSRAPLAVWLHGGDESHLAYNGQLEVAGGLDDRADAITLSPMGRGRRWPWWRGPGEADFLESLEAVRDAYDTDREHELVVGASLGGYATLKFGSLYPDLWSGAFPNCPAEYEDSTGTREPGNELPQTQPFTVTPLIPSLLNVPYRQVSGTLDPLVRIDSGHRVRDAALAAQLDVGYTEYLASDHCFLIPGAGGTWMQNHLTEMVQLLHHPRVTTPGRIRYNVDPRQFVAGSENLGILDIRDIGISYSSVYWLSGLTVRPADIAIATAQAKGVGGNGASQPGPETLGSADVASHALPGWDISTEPCGDSSGFSGAEGTPLAGGNPYAEPDHETSLGTGATYNNYNHWQCQRQLRGGAPGRVLDLHSTNFATMSADMSAAGLADGPFTVHATGDGPLDLTLTGAQITSATGACVGSQKPTANGIELALTLSSTPCDIAVAGGGPTPVVPEAPFAALMVLAGSAAAYTGLRIRARRG